MSPLNGLRLMVAHGTMSQVKTLVSVLIASPDVNGYQTSLVYCLEFLSVFQAAWAWTINSLLSKLTFPVIVNMVVVKLMLTNCITGQYDVWTNCGEAGATFVVLTAVPQDAGFCHSS